MWLFILYHFVLPAAVFYAFTAMVFLSVARIEKSANGKLILDPDSWHFKVAYPFARDKVVKAIRKIKKTECIPPDERRYFDREGYKDARELLASYSRGLCAYFFKFFVMLYFAWPILIILIILWFVVGGGVMSLFGYYPVMENEVPCRRYPLPRVYGIRLLPIYLLALVLYAALWYAYPGDTSAITGVTVVLVGTAALIVAFIWTCVTIICWFRKTDKKSVSMVREWVSAKKQGVCPLTEIKISDV